MRKEWDIPALANALRAETEIAYHPSEGKGILFLVGYTYTKLSVWPHTGHLHVLTPSLTFDAYRMRVASIGEDDAIFEGGRKGTYRYVWLTASGDVFFNLKGTPDRSYEFPQAPLRSPKTISQSL